MTNRIFIFVLLIALVGCKQQPENVGEKPQNIPAKNATTTPDKSLSKVYDLSQIQGLWKSFSYYLEHKQIDKDEHQNEYYKVVSKNRCLDIILKQHDIDSVLYKSYNMGFIDDPKHYHKGMEKSTLKTKGKILVKELKNTYRKGGSLQKFYEDFDSSQNLQRDYDTYELLEDGFEYKNFGIVEKVQFKKISTLPLEIFSALKESSQESSIDYIKVFDIAELSSMVRVKVAKCYFYKDKDLKVKQRAFLIQNDKAYLEAINDQSVKVYFNGKVLTSGYLNKSDVELLSK